MNHPPISRDVLRAAPELRGLVLKWAEIDGVDVADLSAYTVFEVVSRWLLGNEGEETGSSPAIEHSPQSVASLFEVLEIAAKSPDGSELQDAFKSSFLYSLMGDEENAYLIRKYAPLMGATTWRLAREASPTPALDAALALPLGTRRSS